MKAIIRLLRYLVLGVTMLIIALSVSFAQTSVDPTGTYKYHGKTTKKHGETYGYFGTIQVKKLSTTKIVMTFYICKGAPGYNSGSFLDTLYYIGNKAIFKDEGILVQFSFDNKGVSVKEN